MTLSSGSLADAPLHNTAEPLSLERNESREGQRIICLLILPNAALPQGIEGIKGLVEIRVLQVHPKHPHVNTITTKSGIFCRQCDRHVANKLYDSALIWQLLCGHNRDNDHKTVLLQLC